MAFVEKKELESSRVLFKGHVPLQGSDEPGRPPAGPDVVPLDEVAPPEFPPPQAPPGRELAYRVVRGIKRWAWYGFYLACACVPCLLLFKFLGLSDPDFLCMQMVRVGLGLTACMLAAYTLTVYLCFTRFSLLGLMVFTLFVGALMGLALLGYGVVAVGFGLPFGFSLLVVAILLDPTLFSRETPGPDDTEGEAPPPEPPPLPVPSREPAKILPPPPLPWRVRAVTPHEKEVVELFNTIWMQGMAWWYEPMAVPDLAALEPGTSVRRMVAPASSPGCVARREVVPAEPQPAAPAASLHTWASTTLENFKSRMVFGARTFYTGGAVAILGHVANSHELTAVGLFFATLGLGVCLLSLLLFLALDLFEKSSQEASRAGIFVLVALGVCILISLAQETRLYLIAGVGAIGAWLALTLYLESRRRMRDRAAQAAPPKTEAVGR